MISQAGYAFFVACKEISDVVTAFVSGLEFVAALHYFVVSYIASGLETCVRLVILLMTKLYNAFFVMTFEFYLFMVDIGSGLLTVCELVFRIVEYIIQHICAFCDKILFGLNLSKNSLFCWTSGLLHALNRITEGFLDTAILIIDSFKCIYVGTLYALSLIPRSVIYIYFLLYNFIQNFVNSSISKCILLAANLQSGFISLLKGIKNIPLDSVIGALLIFITFWTLKRIINYVKRYGWSFPTYLQPVIIKIQLGARKVADYVQWTLIFLLRCLKTLCIVIKNDFLLWYEIVFLLFNSAKNCAWFILIQIREIVAPIEIRLSSGIAFTYRCFHSLVAVLERIFRLLFYWRADSQFDETEPAVTERQIENRQANQLNDDQVNELPYSFCHKRVSTSRINKRSMSPTEVRQLRQQLENEREQRLCVVCQDQSKSIILLPCRHLCCCDSCLRGLVETGCKCPICRTRILETINVYM